MDGYPATIVPEIVPDTKNARAMRAFLEIRGLPPAG